MNDKGFFDLWTLIKLAALLFILFWVIYIVQNPHQALHDLRGLFHHSENTVKHVIDTAFGQKDSGNWWQK